MLKAVIVDANAISRGLLNTVLTDGGYAVVAQTHTGAHGYALAVKHQPQLICIAREQIEDGSQVVEQLRENQPKTLVFMVAGAIDAATIQQAMVQGVHGFIVKPFKADTVLRTIRNTVLSVIKKYRPAD
jgi:two-component system chemotaxis response regulator CheY